MAPNIYYLGAAGCVQVGGLTIAGISGIYKSHDYSLGRFEQLPYSTSTVRSMYHTRQYDTFRLDLVSCLASPHCHACSLPRIHAAIQGQQAQARHCPLPRLAKHD